MRLERAAQADRSSRRRHDLIYHDHNIEPKPACNGQPKAVTAARAARIDRLLGALEAIRIHTPEFIAGLTDDPKGRHGRDDDDTKDLMRVLALNMVWYVEWPHVDLRFVQMFHTVPGYWAGKPNGSERDEAERTPKAGGDDY
jgi:hypothetical protein